MVATKLVRRAAVSGNGQKIARVARAVEKRRTKHARKWVAIFMNEEGS